MDSEIFGLLSRAALVGFALLYIYQLVIIVHVFGIRSFSKYKYHIGLATTSSLICFLEYYQTFLFGARSTLIVGGIIIATIFFSLYFYIKALEPYFAGGRRFLQILQFIPLFTGVVVALAVVGEFALGLNVQFLHLEPAEVTNRLLSFIYGQNKVVPSPLLKFSTFSLLLTVTLVTVSIFTSFFKNRFYDRIILFGVTMSFITVTYEMFAVSFWPEYFLAVSFFANFPELARITYLEIIKEMQSMASEKEQYARVKALKQESFERARSKIVNQLAAGVAHEINNPLSIILLASRRMHENQADQGDIHLDVQRIEKAANRIKTVTKALIALGSEKEAGLKVVSVENIVSSTTSVFNGMLESTPHIEFKVKHPDKLSLFCEPQAISNALIELLKNSREAVLHLKNRWIHLEVTQKNQFAEFSVTDSGNGICAKIVDQIKHPFFTTKDKHRSLGIGLANVVNTAVRHHGSIDIDTSSQNTRIVLTIPLGNPNTENKSGVVTSV